MFASCIVPELEFLVLQETRVEAVQGSKNFDIGLERHHGPVDAIVHDLNVNGIKHPRILSFVLYGLLRLTYGCPQKKKLTLIILTDGLWSGITSKNAVATGITHAVETARDKTVLRKQLETRGLSI